MLEWSVRPAWAMCLAGAFAPAAPGPRFAQATDDKTGDSDPPQQAERTLRFTLNMARRPGAIYVRETLRKRHDLADDNKASYMSFDADMAREFSRKVSPGVRLLKEFRQRLLDDARQAAPEDKMHT